jgi:nitroimidazol reductase NimA-like FMN-containing flavoprotein (pyridoxamine 5'-phosphate oxidase superfamily)
MPKGAGPERYRDILASTALGHLATIGPDGRPQVNPVRYAWSVAAECLSGWSASITW